MFSFSTFHVLPFQLTIWMYFNKKRQIKLINLVMEKMFEVSNSTRLQLVFINQAFDASYYMVIIKVESVEGDKSMHCSKVDKILVLIIYIQKLYYISINLHDHKFLLYICLRCCFEIQQCIDETSPTNFIFKIIRNIYVYINANYLLYKCSRNKLQKYTNVNCFFCL